MKYTTALLLTITGIVCAIPAGVCSYELSGRVSNDLYTYQSNNKDYVNNYLRFTGNMMAWRGATGRTLHFHTSLRWRSDLADELPPGPSVFVYDAYAVVKGLPQQTDVYIGRQFVYTGVGSALMDGGKLHFRRGKRINVYVFGGSSVSSFDPEQLRSLGEFLVTGGRLGVRPDDKNRLGLSWMLQRHDGEYSYARLGIDANRPAGPAEIYARASFNAINLRAAEYLARAVYRPGAWYLSGEYHWREPLVAGNSIFSVIDFSAYQIGRVEVSRRVWRMVSVVTHAQADLAESDGSWRAGIGFSTPFLSLTYVHKTGYGGDNDGISGRVFRRLTDKLDCYASANLYRYRIQEEQIELSDAYASMVGLRWRAPLGISVTVEGQYLRNAVLEDDSRLLFRVAKDFAVRSKGGAK